MAKRRQFLGTYAQTDMKKTGRGRKPDFWLKAFDKHLGKTSANKVGAAWANEDGSISIDLNSFVTLETVTRVPEDLVITLFPIDRGKMVEETDEN